MVNSGLISILNEICLLYPADISTSVGNCEDGKIRLSNVTMGRVEVCINNAWGTICNNRFGTNEALVTCRQLGYSDTSEFILCHIIVSVQ